MNAHGSRKDPMLAAILGFLFGCFGLLYVSFKHAAIAFVVLFSVGICTGGIGFLGWFLCGFYGYVIAEDHNEKMFYAEETGQQLPPAHQQGVQDWSQPQQPEYQPTPEPRRQAGAGPQSGRQAAAPQERNSDPYANLYCTECGTALNEGDKYCGGCGTATG